MINVVEYRQTCVACPSQWEGTTDKGEFVYARYRHGFLRVEVAPSYESWEKAWGRTDFTVVSGEYGDDLDGFMTDEELRERTQGVITWP